VAKFSGKYRHPELPRQLVDGRPGVLLDIHLPRPAEVGGPVRVEHLVDGQEDDQEDGQPDQELDQVKPACRAVGGRMAITG
jgi:hypothetical protein